MKEFRRITRQAKYRSFDGDGEITTEIYPTTNDYIREDGKYFEYVLTANTTPSGGVSMSMGIFKLIGDKLKQIKKAWNKGDHIEHGDLASQRFIFE